MLNKAQLEAVETLEGQLMIIACPGSGKTTTMLHRIINMVNSGISPNNIIMMTFTKAAAKEMKERYASMAGTQDGVVFSTIHSLCYNIIREKRVRFEVIQEYDTRVYFENILRYNKMVADMDSFIKDLMLDISRRKTANGKPVDIQCTSSTWFFEKLYNDYEAYKKKHNLIDYDDMLVIAYDILQKNLAVLNKYRAWFKYIQVDEYQDTSELQKEIIYLLAGKDGNLAVVGDEDQSIYAFRGATPAVMLDFQRDYPNAKIIKMGTNYRSTTEIVKRASELIKENKDRFDKKFVAYKKAKGKVQLVRYINKYEQADDITKKIEALIKKGADINEIAILYRNNHQAENFVSLFSRKGIDYKVRGGVPDKFDSFIWKDIMIFWRLANNEGSAYDLERAIGKVNRYVRIPPLEEYPDVDVDNHILITSDNEEVIVNYFIEKYSETNSAERWKVKSQLDAVIKTFKVIRVLKSKIKPVDFMNTLWNGLYESYIKEYSKFRNMEMDVFQTKYEDFIKDARMHGNDWKKLKAYAYVYSETLRKNKESKTGITLSTMHSAKGLEWEHVYVIDCINGICPATLNPGITDLEEELRLFYVAVTRAKSHLTLSTYKYDERMRPAKDSPYLKHFQTEEKRTKRGA